MTNTIESIIIDGNSLTLEQIVAVARSGATVSLSNPAKDAIIRSRIWVENAAAENKVIYGITTGFGAFKNIVIGHEETAALQLNLIRSHACGVGEPLSEDVVRALILLRANSLAKGYSGVRLEVIELLLELLNKHIYPYIPSQGSVGSSGDLAPLCHMALVLIGEGECLINGNRMPSNKVLIEKGLVPIILAAKEGLGLSNGTNVQTAVLALAVADAAVLLDSADLIGALTVEVLKGTKRAFHVDVSRVRNQIGQIGVAGNLWGTLQESGLIDTDINRVQDSYSMRCMPQVHGAARDAYWYARSIVEREINAATDNPLIFVDTDTFYSGGNFHGEPIAIASDVLKIAICELGNISERRTAKMVDPAANEGLPAFLISKKIGGLHSGLMIPQYVAAALVSENKVLAHPASVDSIPTSANQEDHVSMGTIAARHAAMVVTNVRRVLAIELLNNTQAKEFHLDAKLAPLTQKLYDLVRSKVPAVVADRPFYTDIETLSSMIYEKQITNIIKDQSFWTSA